MSARDAARAVALRLADAGFEAFFAGGCVRDFLRGESPEDYDIATGATPAEIQKVFPKARGVGEAFGVMLVRHGGHQFEVATFREDGPYHDGRRPSEVRFSSPERDAQRRDFTVNGLFQRPQDDSVVDFVGGRDDLAAGMIRAIGDAHERIREDRLRMLRAVRFAARLGYSVHEATAAAIRAHAAELASVSAERIGDELRKALGHARRLRAVELAESLGLDAVAFGTSNALSSHPRVEALPADAAWTVVLAAWWLDRLVAGRATLVRPDQAAIETLVETLRSRLVLSNAETDALLAALGTREALLAEFADAAHARRARLIAQRGFDAALDLLAGDAPEDAARWRSVGDRELPSRRLPAPIVDGAALVALGFRPGPRFKPLLDAALDAQIEGRISDAASGAEFIRSVTAGDSGL
jgi:poly(A) polymerase